MNNGESESLEPGTVHKVLHVLGTARCEDTAIARMVCLLGANLDPARYRTYCCFLDGDGPLASELAGHGVSAQIIPWSRNALWSSGAWRFFRYVRRGKFSIVHQHYGGRKVSNIARWASRGGLVYHAHGRIVETQGLEVKKIAVPQADVVIACSKAVAASIAAPDVRAIYAGISAPRFDAQDIVIRRARETCVIGTACRLVPAKGVKYLIRAGALLRAEFPQLRIEIAGDGPELPILEKETESLAMGDRVSFLGWQQNLTPVFRRWDLFVLPSVEEGFGVALMEAMAMALPVIASRVGGIPEMVEDGRTGWLVPPADPDALAGRIRKLILDRSEASAAAARAQAIVRERFAAKPFALSVERVYDEILLGRNFPRRSTGGADHN